MLLSLQHVTKITTQQNLLFAPNLVQACTMERGTFVFDFDPVRPQGRSQATLQHFTKIAQEHNPRFAFNLVQTCWVGPGTLLFDLDPIRPQGALQHHKAALQHITKIP